MTGSLQEKNNKYYIVLNIYEGGKRKPRLHDLRHSCASILLSQGCTLKDVQDWLGHAEIDMTANLYGHLDLARKKAIAKVMSNRLAKTNLPKLFSRRSDFGTRQYYRIIAR